jgi:hypothetical protein
MRVYFLAFIIITTIGTILFYYVDCCCYVISVVCASLLCDVTKAHT